MAKFTPPSRQASISRSSLRVPKAMLPLIEAAMADSPYNKKQRSKWIEDITAQFIARGDAANLIAEEFIVPGSTVSIPLTFSTELDQQIASTLDAVLAQEQVTTDRSSVIRTAITQQLLAVSGRQLSSVSLGNR